MSLRGETAVVGVGLTEFGGLPGHSAYGNHGKSH